MGGDRSGGPSGLFGYSAEPPQLHAAPLAFDEVSFLLWATQGVRQQVAPGAVLRTVPSAGNRHALETYLAVLRVSGLPPGIYRYLPLEHQLLHVLDDEQLPEKLADATLGHGFIGRAAAVFIWTTIPYRMEWRTGWPPTR